MLVGKVMGDSLCLQTCKVESDRLLGMGGWVGMQEGAGRVWGSVDGGCRVAGLGRRVKRGVG